MNNEQIARKLVKMARKLSGSGNVEVEVDVDGRGDIGPTAPL